MVEHIIDKVAVIPGMYSYYIMYAWLGALSRSYDNW